MADASLDVPSKQGGWVVKEVARLVLCTTTTHSRLAPRLWSIVERLLELAPAGIDLAFAMPSGDWTEPRSQAQLARHVKSVARWPTNGTCSISGLRDEYEFDLEYHGSASVWTRRGWASTFTVTFPRARLDDPMTMEAWLGGVLQLAPWTSATLGLALEGNEWRIYPLAEQHLALDISSPSANAHDLGGQVYGTGWLTFLSGKQVSALGGAPKVKKALRALNVQQLADGLLVRVSPRPRRGTTAAERKPYAVLARTVEPVLHRPVKVLSMATHPIQRAWHERFLHPLAAYRRAFAPVTRPESLPHRETPF